MADQKVSDLPSLNGADVDAADLLYIIDASAGSAGSKKITVGQYQLAPVSGGTANGVVYLNASKVATAGSDLVFDGSNLGIGTSSPAYKLDVVSGSGSLAKFTRGSISISAFIGASEGFWGTDTNHPLAFTTNGTERMRLDSSGNLGIGTTSPAGKLESAGTSNGATLELLRLNNLGSGANTQAQINFIAATASYGTITGGFGSAAPQMTFNLPNATAGNFVWQITSTERMRLDSSGNLGIGTTSPTGKLEVVAAAAQNAINIIVPTVDYFSATMHNQATSGDNVFIAFGTEAAFTTRGSINYNRAGGLVAYNTTSDYRAKDILGPVQNSGATIDALKVYEGQMKGASQSRPMLVAHEAQEHAPYAVTGEKDAVNEDGTPKYQQMDVSALVPLLLAEVQSLRARVAALESA